MIGCSSPNSVTTNEQSNEELMVMNVWGRPLPVEVENGAFYMDLANHSNSDETLLSADITQCTEVQIHEMSIDDLGVMHMQEVANGRLSLPAQETVHLKPGGLHIMCLGKSTAFEVGDEISVTLHFANHDNVVVTAVIQEEAITSEHNMDHSNH